MYIAYIERIHRAIRAACRETAVPLLYNNYVTILMPRY